MVETLVAIHVEPLDDGGFLATSVELPGLIAQGRTLAETLEIAQDVARKLIESYIEHGDELPPALRAAASSSEADLRIPVTVG
jgi:predicted RNase H-like HicB family nuclease